MPKSSAAAPDKIDKIFITSDKTNLMLFFAFRPDAASFKQIKSTSAHPDPANDPVTCWLNASPMPGQGASDAVVRSLARVACGHACVRFNLVRAG
jgi:hypothetical protein